MTAINVVLLADEVHFFSDAGLYDTDTLELRGLGSKVLPLRHLNAAVAYSGLSSGVRRLYEAAQPYKSLHDIVAAFPAIIEAIRPQGRYAAFVAGVEQGHAIGRAVEENGRDHLLVQGSVIKSLPSGLSFDTDDIVGSGLTIMEDQRRNHPVVAGWCDHTLISPPGIHSERLREWDDASAKIVDLTVDHINIAPGAVTGSASVSAAGATFAQTISVPVPNPFNFPIKLLASISYSYSGTAGQSQAGFSIVIKRDGTTIYSKTNWFTGAGSKSGAYAPAFLDLITGGHTYALTVTPEGDPNGSGGSISYSGFSLTGFYTQK